MGGGGWSLWQGDEGVMLRSFEEAGPGGGAPNKDRAPAFYIKPDSAMSLPGQNALA